MDNLESGHYTFKSTSSISISASTDYQTTILQVMWFSGVHAVSDGGYDMLSYTIPHIKHVQCFQSNYIS